MAKKKRELSPRTKKELRQQLKEVAAEGGKKRWEGVSAEERSRIARLGGLKSAAVRAAKKKTKEGKK